MKSLNCKTLCFVTGTRADFGLLKPLMKRVMSSEKLSLQLIATGAHLSDLHGRTVNEVKDSGFQIDEEVDIFQNLLEENDNHFTDSLISNAVGCGLQKFTQSLLRLKPNAIVVLGDRYEVLAAALAAFFLKIPVVHLHGGEVTQGALDDTIRHTLTKIAHYHFVGSDKYRSRVLQLGENPKNVFNFGGLGVDAIFQEKLLSKEYLEQSLNLTISSTCFLVTYHPETYLTEEQNLKALNNMLAAIESFGKGQFIFTLPNADSGNDILSHRIIEFCEKKPDFVVVNSLGHIRYLSALQVVSGVLGNSSSGIAEAPSFKIATINIGSRQKGRESAESVINVPSETLPILEALEKSLTPSFRAIVENAKNPYGDGGASAQICQKLENLDFDHLPPKVFFDLPAFGLEDL